MRQRTKSVPLSFRAESSNDQLPLFQKLFSFFLSLASLSNNCDVDERREKVNATNVQSFSSFFLSTYAYACRCSYSLDGVERMKIDSNSRRTCTQKRNEDDCGERKYIEPMYLEVDLIDKHRKSVLLRSVSRCRATSVMQPASCRRTLIS